MRQVPKNKDNKLHTLFALTLFDHVALTIGFPVLTFLCFDSHSTIFTVTTPYSVRAYWYGIFNALPHFIAIAAAPLLGFISDYLGRKKVLLIGAFGALFLCLFITLGILFASLSLVIVGCLLAGLCARTEPIALAVVGDLSSPLKKLSNMGYLQFSISLGAFFGPILGGYFVKRYFFPQLNFALPYVIGIVAASISIIITQVYFHDSASKQSVKMSCATIKEIFSYKVFIISMLLILTQISWRFYYQFIPPVLKLDFHYAAASIGLFIAVIAIWLSIASFVVIRILNRFFALKKIMIYAIYMMLLGFALTILAVQIDVSWLLWTAAAFIAMGDVIVYSAIVTLYSEAVASQHQGKIMGLCFVIVASVWGVTGLFGGYLISISIILPLLLAPISLIILLIFPVHNKLS